MTVVPLSRASPDAASTWSPMALSPADGEEQFRRKLGGGLALRYGAGGGGNYTYVVI